MGYTSNVLIKTRSDAIRICILHFIHDNIVANDLEVLAFKINLHLKSIRKSSSIRIKKIKTIFSNRFRGWNKCQCDYS